MSHDRTEQPVVGSDPRTAQGHEIQRQNSESEQIRTLLDRQREQILADCQAEISKHEFQADYDRRSIQKLSETIESQKEELHRAQADERRRQDQQLLHEQLLKQNWDLREAHEKSLKEMKELKRFQSSTFDTLARRRLAEDRDTIHELTGKIQEIQNEINCMSDSRDFLDAESVRSGLSHVPSQLVSFPPHPIPGGELSRSVVMPSRKDGLPSIWDTHCISGNVCAGPVVSSTAPYPQELNPWSSGTEERIHSSTVEKGEKQTPVQDQRCQSGPSAKDSVIPSEETLQRIMGQINNDCRFLIFISKIHHTINVCLLEDKIQDWGMYLITISCGSYAVDQRSGDGWFSGWFKIFIINTRYFNAEFWSTWCEDCFSTEQNHPEYPLQEKGLSGGNENSQRRPIPSRKTDRLADLRVLLGHWSQWFCRELCRPIYSRSSKWWYSGIRFEMGRNSIVNDANPIWWHHGKLVQIKNTRVWETQDRIGIVWPEDSSEEVRTWSSQTENYGEKKYRAGNSK